MWCRVSGGCRAKIEVASGGGVMSNGGTTSSGKERFYHGLISLWEVG